MKHIVLATDLSESSTRALAPIGQLAQALGAKITLLHVLDSLEILPHGAPLAPPQHEPATEQEIQETAGALEKLRTQLPQDVTVETRMVRGGVARATTEYAREHGADLIALSTHGRSGMRRFLLGSVAEEILRAATTPVACFPPPDE